MNNIQAWEQIWAEHTKSKWTHKIFSTIQKYLDLNHKPTFWSSQSISGHGLFREYLHTRQRAPAPDCPCGMGNESAEHVLTACPQHKDDRPPNWKEIGPDHIAYMEATVEKLWVIENSNFVRRHQV